MQWTIDVSPELDAQSRWREIVSIDLTFTTFMVIIVALRFWTKRKTLQIEDWIIAFSAFTALNFNVASIIQTRFGYGLPPDERAESQRIPFALINYPWRPLCALCLGSFTLALCISYSRLLNGTEKSKYRWFIIGTGVFTVLGHITVAMLFFFQCDPVWKTIDSTAPGHCLDYRPLSYFFSTVSIVSDVTVFLMPIPLVLRTNLDRGTKIGLCFVFSLGLCTTILTILRTTQVPVIGAGDGDSTLFGLYAAVESNVGVITACLPVLRPMFISAQRRFVGKVMSNRSQSSSAVNSAKRHTIGSYKLANRFGSSESNTRNTTTDGDSIEIMLEQPSRSYTHGEVYSQGQVSHGQVSSNGQQSLPLQDLSKGQDTWEDMSIVKTVDYSVHVREDTADVEAARHQDKWRPA